MTRGIHIHIIYILALLNTKPKPNLNDVWVLELVQHAGLVHYLRDRVCVVPARPEGAKGLG